MTENEIAKIVVDVAVKLHVALGPGLLESVYEVILAYELRKRGLKVETQVPVPVIYETVKMELGFKADLIVGDKVIVELKSVSDLAGVHKKQLATYLKLTNLKLGLLINFGGELMRGNIQRVVNGLEDD
jgi:GxxExxY protein